MRNPIQVVRENYQMAKESAVETYEENKAYYSFCAGSIATSAATYALIKFLESKGFGKSPGITNTFLGEIPLSMTADEVCELFKRTKAITITHPGTGNSLALLASDFVETIVK